MKTNKSRVLASLIAAALMASMAGCGGDGASSTPASSGTGGSSAGGAACSEGGSSQTASGEPAELTVWVAGNGDVTMDDTYRKVYDDYCTAHPEISYELTFIAWGEYFTKLNAGLAGGAAADVFMTGYGQLGTVASMDYLLPLDDYIPADWDGWTDFSENLINIGKYDGKQVAFLQSATRVLFYRKDIAEQQGVTEDELTLKTMDDYHNLVRKMAVKDDAGNLVMGGIDLSTLSTSSSPEQQYIIHATHHGALEDVALWNDDLTAAFNSDIGTATFEELMGLYNEGVSFPSDPANSSTMGIQSGLSAMSWGAESSYGTLDAAFPGQIGIVKSELGTMLIGNFMVVNAATKYPQQSVDFLLNMYSSDSCKAFAEGLGQYPGRASLDSWYVENWPEFENVVLAYQNAIPMSYTLTPKYTNLVQIFRTASETIFSGGDIKETLVSAEEEWNALLNE